MNDKRLYQKVANQILEMIDGGIFPPGSRLPGERDLAEKFGVSRVAVREAEIALQALGRVTIKGGSGVYVSVPDGSSAALPCASPFELTEARALFEAEAAALAAPLITDEDIAKLESHLAVMSDKKSSKVAIEEADRAFHQTIARATNNPAIIHIINTLWQMRSSAIKIQKIYSTVCDNDHASRKQEHGAVLDALRNRDAMAARRTMRAHFTRMIESLLVSSEEEALQAARRKASESRARFLLSKDNS